VDLSGLTNLIVSAHNFIAMVRDEDHWMLDDEDSKELGRATKNFLRHFSLEATQKGVDIATFAITFTTMESIRVARSWQLHKQAKAPRRPVTQTGNVFHFTTPQNPAPSPSSPTPAATQSAPTGNAPMSPPSYPAGVDPAEIETEQPV
jgi:hypothetical protein